MTTSNDKRSRLVDTAAELIRTQGFHRTTLADIARDSQVPLGNVYYYFKTKEALGEALIDALLGEYTALIERWEQKPGAVARLLAFVQTTVENRETLVQSGCSIGTLCTELHKEGGALAIRAAKLFEMLLRWIEAQFRQLGVGAQSRDHAAHLLGALQGASVLTHTFHDERYTRREAQRMKQWIQSFKEVS